MSGKIPAEQAHTRLSKALDELQGLRNNLSIPEALLDVWETKFNRWLSELSNINEEEIQIVSCINENTYNRAKMLPTAHQDQRTVAQAHVTSYTAQMKATMQKLQKHPKNIKKGDLVYLRIPKADKNKFDRTKLACKVIQ
ncbi:6454_t:CDS:2, partial [Paraglomus brasilianum]